MKLLRNGSSAGTREIFPLHLLVRSRRDESIGRIRALCDNAYVGSGTTLCRVLGRYKMYVDSHDISISSHLILDGFWEIWVTEVLRKLIKPGMRVADVGANLGYFTLLMADLCGQEGHVHAFEPNPPIVARLVKSCTANGFLDRVTVYPDVLGEEEGRQMTLFVPHEQPGGASVHAAHEDEVPSALSFSTRRMDSFPELADVDLVKIDAEAAEQAIWRGMSGILARGRPMTMLVEFTACRYPDPGGFLDEIAAAGFDLSYIDPTEGIVSATRAEILSGSATADQMLLLRR